MTPEQQKEEISRAYVHAVAAWNGFKLGTWSVDDGCTLANPKINVFSPDSLMALMLEADIQSKP